MGLLQSLFGGSKQSSTSDNKSFDFLKGALQPAISGGTNMLNRLNDELSGGFDGFKKNIGFDFMLGEGLKGITGGRAASGLLRSGGTGGKYLELANNLGTQAYSNYLDRLGTAGQLGLGAAGTLAGAGQTSTSKGKSNNGILSTLFG